MRMQVSVRNKGGPHESVSGAKDTGLSDSAPQPAGGGLFRPDRGCLKAQGLTVELTAVRSLPLPSPTNCKTKPSPQRITPAMPKKSRKTADSQSSHRRVCEFHSTFWWGDSDVVPAFSLPDSLCLWVECLDWSPAQATAGD